MTTVNGEAARETFHVRRLTRIDAQEWKFRAQTRRRTIVKTWRGLITLRGAQRVKVVVQGKLIVGLSVKLLDVTTATLIGELHGPLVEDVGDVGK